MTEENSTVVTMKECIEADIMYLESEIRRLKMQVVYLKVELACIIEEQEKAKP